MKNKKIYCAGPLFNEHERENMKQIADYLENSGYNVFLPQRDGIELSSIKNSLNDLKFDFDIELLISKLIFHIDIYQIYESDGIILNLNGRVPDEGTMVEGGIAWALSKPVVIYKCDSRSAFFGNDNPMIVGLSSFEVEDDISKIANKFDLLFSNGYNVDTNLNVNLSRFDFQLGKELYESYKAIKNEASFQKEIGKILKALEKDRFVDKHGIAKT